MSLTFPLLIILLLPGFLSLWVYRGFTLEEIHKKGEWHYCALGLLFGVLNLGAFLLPSKCFIHSFVSLLQSESAEFFISFRFWIWYFGLVISALVIGLLCGLLFARFSSPVGFLRRIGAKILGVPCITAAESALNDLIREMYRENDALLVGVSEYEGGSFKLLGFYHSNSLNPMEIALNETNLFRGLSGNELQMVRSLSSSSVLLESGLIVTLMPMTKDERTGLITRLEEMRETIISSPSFFRDA